MSVLLLLSPYEKIGKKRRMNIPKNHTVRIQKSKSEYVNKRIEIGRIERLLLLNGLSLFVFCKKCRKGTVIKMNSQ